MRSIARTHPSILHEDTEGKKAFAVDDLSDLLDGIFADALKPSGCNLRLVKPIVQPQTDEAAGMLATFQTGFSVSQHVESLTNDAVQAAFKVTAEIVRQIIAKLIFDSRRGVELFRFSLNNLSYGRFNIEEITFKGDGSFHGQLCIFQFKVEYIEDIDDLVESTEWLNLI